MRRAKAERVARQANAPATHLHWATSGLRHSFLNFPFRFHINIKPGLTTHLSPRKFNLSKRLYQIHTTVILILASLPQQPWPKEKTGAVCDQRI
jgi:hypothetical protein